MKYWALALTTLAALPANAYVRNWRETAPIPTESPSEVLRRLQRRADTCPSDHPTSCAAVDSKLPGNFCCASTESCISIDSSSSAICCPTGSDCSTIGTINCDVSLQDAGKHQGPIYTINTSVKLSTCGSSCCPFGYACGNSRGQDVCVLDGSKAKFGGGTTTGSSQTGTPTTTRVTSTTSTTVTVTPTDAFDSNNAPPSKPTNFPPGVFFAGFFPGMLVGALAVLAWVMMTGRNRRPQDTRGLNMSGNGARPFISLPMKSDRHSNERSDFLNAARRRTKSMFSTHRNIRTMNSPDILGHKMPTPPTNSNIPVNYINDMPDVLATPQSRVARYNGVGGPEYRDSFDRRISEDEKDRNFGPESIYAPSVSDPTRSETIRIYSPELAQQQVRNANDVFASAPAMPAIPAASVPPLRGMNGQRRVTPPYGSVPAVERRDSGKGMGLGAAFETPAKKTQEPVMWHDSPSRRPNQTMDYTKSVAAEYDDVDLTLPVEFPRGLQPSAHQQATATATATDLQTLTPARYDPNSKVNSARDRLSKDQRTLPSRQPVIPPRPQNKPSKTQPHPDTEYGNDNDADADFDWAAYDKEMDDAPPRSSDRPNPYPATAASTTRPAANDNTRANPAATFDNFVSHANLGRQESTKKDKHATNATTFTSMLNYVGLPDSGDQFPVPKVPEGLKGKGKGKKGKKMI